ncbi:hypothetical protein LZ199_21950 [Myxococcus sp. QH3KD-4-1]|nr:hypothetical protein [Myxococcus qinghaiensis]
MKEPSMRHLAPPCLLLALAACGGDFSNDDLEFLNALPQREDLSVTTPGERMGGGTGQRLVRQGKVGSPSALMEKLGDASALVGNTDETGRDINESIGGILDSVESITRLTPTKREPNRRVWGPILGKNDMEFDTRFVMTREGERFEYQTQYRRVGGGENDWWSFLEGTFQADGGVRKGTGRLSIDWKRAREEEWLFSVDFLDGQEIRYQTQRLPTQVELEYFGPLPDIFPGRYMYREAEGDLAEMTFEMRGTDFVPGGLPENVALVTRWAPDGRGTALLEILSGDIVGAKYTECWDAQGRVTFISRSWDFLNPTEGVRASCPDMSALDR